MVSDERIAIRVEMWNDENFERVLKLVLVLLLLLVLLFL